MLATSVATLPQNAPRESIALEYSIQVADVHDSLVVDAARLIR